MEAEFIVEPGRLIDLLRRLLRGRDSIRLDAAIAFVRSSGVALLKSELIQFSKSKPVRIVVGLDFRMTSYEALDSLLLTDKQNASIFAYKSCGADCFHPKTYLFTGRRHAILIVGSANLTQGDVGINQEGVLVVRVDLQSASDRRIYEQVVSKIDQWTSSDNPHVRLLTVGALREMMENGAVVSEQEVIARRLKDAQAPV